MKLENKILHLLAKNQTAGLYHSDICSHLGVNHHEVSRAIQNLDRSSFLDKSKHPNKKMRGVIYRRSLKFGNYASVNRVAQVKKYLIKRIMRSGDQYSIKELHERLPHIKRQDITTAISAMLAKSQAIKHKPESKGCTKYSLRGYGTLEKNCFHNAFAVVFHGAKRKGIRV